MSESNRAREFFTLPTRDYPSDEDLRQNPVQPVLDTLFSEFARRHRSISPPNQASPRSVRSHLRQSQQPILKPPLIDLRALEYTSDSDSHLMCPICHVPFIDPIVLDCDHTFCASCYTEYRNTIVNNERSQCPSCRTLVSSSPRKASRLIHNMCSDLKVRCPNEDCDVVIARAYVERHATRDCPEQRVPCPDTKCDKQTKRKNYVPGQCIHATQVECDCGAVINLGQGEWLKHKDQDCPKMNRKCEKCGAQIASDTQAEENTEHVCQPKSDYQQCVGVQFGCTDEVSPEDFESHISTCTFARMAPFLKSQSRLLQTVQDQLNVSKFQNETLEAELDRMNHIITHQVQPRLEQYTATSQMSDTLDYSLPDHENDIEEIPRDNIPSAAAIHHRDLVLPAHIRDLTPSPEMFATPTAHSPHVYTHNQASIHNHLLSLYESLRHTVSNLEAEITSLHHAFADLDARTSMQLMNETLRIKEDLAYTNAALTGHRSQLQWLLNRERIGREQAILRERGRAATEHIQSQSQPQGTNEMERQNSSLASPPATGSSSHQQTEPLTFPFPNPGAGMARTVSGSAVGSWSGPSSAATSPIFSGINMVGAGSTGSTRRPSMRGGSQERVKL